MKDSVSERSVDFYLKHKISPVSKDISDVEVHFEKRESLFRHIGIVPTFLKNKTVLEFGPGGGHNSIYTLSLLPDRYVLVDGNPTGLESVSKLFAQYDNGTTKFEVVESFIEQFSTSERFDFVICENVIPLQQNDPRHVLQRVAEFVKPGGVLVVTCMDPVSFLADVLGQLAGELLVVPNMTIEEKLDVMRPFFQMNLEALPGANTLVDDFMMDSVIQHYPKDGKMQSVSDTIDALMGDFEIYASSPNFMVDWRWYKNIHGDQAQHNQRAIEQYERNIHNMLDYRGVSTAVTAAQSATIRGLCDNIFEATKKFRIDRDHKYLEAIRADLVQLAEVVSSYSQETADSLTDFVRGVDAFLEGKPWPELNSFVAFFGRGTQYLSFIRKHLAV
jgi:2-polyprenyl-3-methyl-5-hydroxy-6-metoxy-1,4-benzoquinol methylase